MLSCVKRLIVLFPCVGVLSLFFFGCGAVGSALVGFVVPDELPAGIEAVIAERDRFKQASDDPLNETEAGRALEGLGGLTGCWGAYDRFDLEAENEFSGDLPGMPATISGQYDDFEYYRFDVGHGEYDYMAYQYSPLTGFAFFTRWTGDLAVVGENRIRVVITKTYFNNPLTGEIETITREADEEDPIVEYLVTLDADHMKIRAADEAGREEEQRENLVFARFDCPS